MPNLGQNLQNGNKINSEHSVHSVKKSEQRNRQTAVRITHLGKKAVKGNRPYQLAGAEDRGLPAAAGRLRDGNG